MKPEHVERLRKMAAHRRAQVKMLDGRGLDDLVAHDREDAEALEAAIALAERVAGVPVVTAGAPR